jgi:hypothetical protein
MELAQSFDRFNPGSAPVAHVYPVGVLLLAPVLNRAIRLAFRPAFQSDNSGIPCCQTTARFQLQPGRIVILIVAMIIDVHLIVSLRSVETALLATASAASIVIGLAARIGPHHPVAVIALLIYRPFDLGDRTQRTETPGLKQEVSFSPWLRFKRLL